MTDSRIKELTDGLLESVEKERSGEISQNNGRLSKGMYLTLLEREGIKLKSEGQNIMVTPLQFAISTVDEVMSSKGVVEFNLEPEEVSIVRKAFVRVAEPLGGIDAEFLDYFAVNPKTGARLVIDDKGTPFRKKISEIAVNKLYLISDWAEHDFDTSLSFAKKVSERSLKKINRVWRVRQDPNVVYGIINDLVDAASHLPQIADVEVETLVAKELGEELKPDSAAYKNIQVPGHVYDGVYQRTRSMTSLILGFLGHENMLEKQTGLVMPGMFIETVLSTLLDPQDHSYKNVMELLIMSGLITTEEAAQFVLAWNEDGLEQTWLDRLEEQQ